MTAKKPGRPPVTFTDKDREEIKKLSGLCLSIEEIARIKGCDRDTLSKWCHDEIEEGRVEAKALAIDRLFRNIKAGKEASIFFYLKTRHQWREVQRIESVAEVHHKGIIKEEPLSDAEWERVFGAGADTDGLGSPTGTTTRSH